MPHAVGNTHTEIVEGIDFVCNIVMCKIVKDSQIS